MGSEMCIRDRPWGLMPNGDLWHVIHQHVLAKGSDHITCSKVKGHATDQDVSNGIATREDKLGNDTADKVADLGVQCQTAWMHHLCHIFHVRQYVFQRLLHEIYDLFIDVQNFQSESRVHLATQLHLNGGDDSQQGIAPALPYQPPSWGQRRLSMRRYNKAMHATSDSVFVRVYAFLSTLDVCDLQQVAEQQPVQGCSWLELFSFFELQGGHSSTDAVSMPQESIISALAGFKRTVLHVADVCLDAAQRALFGPSKLTIRRLKSLGYSNHCACMNMQVFFPPELQRPLRNTLLSLRMPISTHVSTKLDEGAIFLKAVPIPLKGAPAWRKSSFFRCSNAISLSVATLSSESVPSLLGRNPLVLLCPVVACRHMRDVTTTPLYNKGKWSSLSCAKCARMATCRKWLCICGVPWFGCTHHGPVGFVCGKASGSVKRERPQTVPAPVPTTFSNNESFPRTPIDATIAFDGDPARKRAHLQKRGLKRRLSRTSDNSSAVASVSRLRLLREPALQAAATSSSDHTVMMDVFREPAHQTLNPSSSACSLSVSQCTGPRACEPASGAHPS